jgi:conjugative relaxase-like TrwC/TraI family protein
MAVRVLEAESVEGSKRYFTEGLERSDYYGQDGYTPGLWFGKGAERLGLEGRVAKQDFFRLLEGRDPRSGEKLTVRLKDNRRPGYEIVFSGPKGFSSAWARASKYPGLQEKLIDAFRQSVIDTLREDVEPLIKTRLRRNGLNADVAVGNMIASLFTHFETRPLEDGGCDPHVHLHAYLMNLVWAPHEDRFQAGQFDDLFIDRDQIEAAFEARLALRLKALQAPIERQVKDNGRLAWDIGVPQTLIAKDSRRTQEIEALRQRWGITDPKARSQIGPRMRRGKDEGLGMTRAEQHAYWENERQTPEERQALDPLLARMAAAAAGDGASALASGNDPERCRLAVDWAMRHVFQREATARAAKLESVALRYGVGNVSPEGVRAAIEEQIARGNLLAGLKDGRRLLTTPVAYARDQWIIGWARDGMGTCDPLAEAGRPIKRDWLKRQQKKAVRMIWDSCDRVMLVGASKAAPGVGKTTLLEEAVEGIEAGGKEVFAFAPSAAASRGTLREAGFPDAETVARLLKDERLQQRVAGQALLVDETALLGGKDAFDFFRLADRLGCRVIVVSDTGQHAAVEHPGVVRLLETRAGLPVAEVTEIQRQKGKYKKIVEQLVRGDTDAPLQRMKALGWLHEIKDPEERERRLAADYLAVISSRKKNGQHKTALVVSPTHAEGERNCATIRDELKRQGRLGTEERELTRLDKIDLTEAQKEDPLFYSAGQEIQFYQNAKGGFTRGDRVTVAGRDDLGHVCVRTAAGEVKPLRLDQAAKYEVFRRKSLKLAAGDRIRITGNGHDTSGEHGLNNGVLYTLKGFTGKGDLVLENGWVVSRDYGHLAQGYVITSQASQSKTVDVVLGGMGSQSFPAMSLEGLRVLVSRGREQAILYTDDLAGLKRAVRRSEQQLTATELLEGPARRRARLTEHALYMQRWQAMTGRIGQSARRLAGRGPAAAVAVRHASPSPVDAPAPAEPRAEGWARPELRTSRPQPRPPVPDKDGPGPEMTR